MIPASSRRDHTGSNSVSKGDRRPSRVVGAAARITTIRAPCSSAQSTSSAAQAASASVRYGRGVEAVVVREAPVLGQPAVEGAEGVAHRLGIVGQRLLVDHPERREHPAAHQPLLVEHPQAGVAVAVLGPHRLESRSSASGLTADGVAAEVVVQAAGLRHRVERGVAHRTADPPADHVVRAPVDLGPLDAAGRRERGRGGGRRRPAPRSSGCQRRKRAHPWCAIVREMTAADLAEVDLTDLDNFADGFPHDLFARAPPRGAGVVARAHRAHARRRGVLVGRHLRRGARGAARPRRPTRRSGAATGRYGGTLLQDLAVAGARAQHDGRPAPRADPPPREHRAHAAHGPPARGRAAPAHPACCSTASTTASTVDFLVDGRGRAADAGDLHPARRPRGGPPRAVRGGRARLRLPRATRESSSGRPSATPTRRACSSTARDARSPRSGRTRPTTCSRSSSTRRCDDVDPPQLTDAELYAFFSLLFAAGLRDHPQRDRRRPARAARAPRPARRACAPTPRCCRRPSRRCCGGRRRRRRSGAPPRAPPTLGGHAHRAGRQGRSSGRARPTATSASSTRADGVRHPPRPEPAPRLRPRRPLLPRRQPRPARDAGACSRSCCRASRRSSWPARSSGPAATATPASATCGARSDRRMVVAGVSAP